jgi:hypothetical protein
MVRITDAHLRQTVPSQGSHLSRIVDRASASFSPLPLSDRSIDFYVRLIRSELTQQVGVPLRPPRLRSRRIDALPTFAVLTGSEQHRLGFEAAGNGETPANDVHDHDTVHLSSVRVRVARARRSPCLIPPLQRNTSSVISQASMDGSSR